MNIMVKKTAIISGFLLQIVLFLYIDAYAEISEGQRNALIALYNSLDGDNWQNNSNWLDVSGTEGSWYGVTLDSTETMVIELHLTNNNLVGIIPPEIGDLIYLNILDLSGEVPNNTNIITGSIPPEIGNLTNLTRISLAYTELTGSIPKEIGNLTKTVC